MSTTFFTKMNCTYLLFMYCSVNAQQSSQTTVINTYTIVLLNPVLVALVYIISLFVPRFL